MAHNICKLSTKATKPVDNLGTTAEQAAMVWVCVTFQTKRTWKEVVEKDCQARILNKEDAMDHSRWRKLIKDV